MKKDVDIHLSYFHKKNIDITPLVDVIFIVLSFLIISVNFRQEGIFNVNLPKAKLSMSSGKKNKYVLVVKKNSLHLNGEEILNKSELIKKLVGYNVKALEIKGDKDIPYERIIKIMDIAIASNVHKLMLTTEKGE